MHHALRAPGGVPRSLSGSWPKAEPVSLAGFSRQGASTRRTCARRARGETG